MQIQVQGQMSDKEIINDSLATQKFIASGYNTYAGECSNINLKNDMINILAEEHAIHADLFNEMQARGWYQTETADQQKINTVKSKFASQG